MDEEIFNMQLRKFLKNDGNTSQREIESAVRKAIASGAISETESINAKVTLKINELDLVTNISGNIKLK